MDAKNPTDKVIYRWHPKLNGWVAWGPTTLMRIGTIEITNRYNETSERTITRLIPGGAPNGVEMTMGILAARPTATPAAHPTQRRCEECGAPIVGASHADDVADGRMPGYCRNC